MIFGELSEYLAELERTTSRNTITQILADVFKKSGSGEIAKICYLLLGRIAPSYTGVEFNFAEKMMIRAIGRAYGVEPKRVLRMYKQRGDLGDAAYAIAREKGKGLPARLDSASLASWRAKRAGKAGKREKLSVREVFERLKRLATEGGGGSQERKLQTVSQLLAQADPLSAKYIARIPTGKLRLGFSDMTILDALSVAKVGDKSARKNIETAYNVTADIGRVAEKVKLKGLAELEKTKAVPGVPIRTSLAERLPSAAKIVEKLGPKVAVEPKFDGFRVGIHVWGSGRNREVRLFSRNQENVTDMFPEIAAAAGKLQVKDVILDGEAIGYNPKTGKFTTFQETVQRKRKYEVAEFAKKVPLKLFVFDVLYLNGKDLTSETFRKRRQTLQTILPGRTGTILLTDQATVETVEGLRKLFEVYSKEGLEGVVAKKLDEPYRAGGRGFHWVKYKRHTEESELADTVDCVLMGAYRGRGKRATFGVGSFLLGVAGGNKYYTVSNLGTGLTDEQFRQVYKIVKSLKVGKQPKDYVVDRTVVPDIWVAPEVVLEILADEITLSPRHTAGRDRDRDKQSLSLRDKQSLPLRGRDRGFSLRFPRLVRVRSDKGPEQATTVGELKKLYKMQGRK